MRLKIEIEMDNDAFVGRQGEEAAVILKHVMPWIECIDASWKNDIHSLHDSNGNKVGYAKVMK